MSLVFFCFDVFFSGSTDVLCFFAENPYGLDLLIETEFWSTAAGMVVFEKTHKQNTIGSLVFQGQDFLWFIPEVDGSSTSWKHPKKWNGKTMTHMSDLRIIYHDVWVNLILTPIGFSHVCFTNKLFFWQGNNNIFWPSLILSLRGIYPPGNYIT